MMKRTDDFRLYLVTDRILLKNQSIKTLIRGAIEGGVTAIQLRAKEMPIRYFIEMGKQVKAILADTPIPLIINDRIDVALACEADGVHLGQSDISYVDARKILGSEKIIGVSVSTIDEAYKLNRSEVSYIGVSPIFHTATKNDITEPWGLTGLMELRRQSHHKLIAIGGINSNNIQGVLDAGADGIAVASAICDKNDPKVAAAQLRESIDFYFTQQKRGNYEIVNHR
jgi:thiamine-phosphate pyrophosphorylase